MINSFEQFKSLSSSLIDFTKGRKVKHSEMKEFLANKLCGSDVNTIKSLLDRKVDKDSYIYLDYEKETLSMKINFVSKGKFTTYYFDKNKISESHIKKYLKNNPNCVTYVFFLDLLDMFIEIYKEKNFKNDFLNIKYSDLEDDDIDKFYNFDDFSLDLDKYGLNLLKYTLGDNSIDETVQEPELESTELSNSGSFIYYLIQEWVFLYRWLFLDFIHSNEGKITEEMKVNFFIHDYVNCIDLKV